jgi:hypothetical protein
VLGKKTGKLAAQELWSELVVAGKMKRAGIYRGRKGRGMRRWEFGRKEEASWGWAHGPRRLGRRDRDRILQPGRSSTTFCVSI